MRHYLDLALAAVLAVVVCVAVALLVPTLEEIADESLILANATIAGAPISALFVSFLFYSFLGWAFESVLCSLVNLGHFTNCGFLLGPYCPIYGTGALACWLLLRGFDSVPALFLVSALVCCCIEYAVGWALEKATHARFWDYSNLPFNLHGRVCLYSALLFGTACTLVCRVVEPALLNALAKLPAWVVMLVAGALLVVLVIDVATSVSSWRRLFGALDELRDDFAERTNETLAGFSDRMLDDLPEGLADSMEAVTDRARGVNDWLAGATDSAVAALRSRWHMPSFVEDGQRSLTLAAERLKVTLSKRDLRFFNAFPALRIIPYEGVIRATELKERARDLFRRRKG